MKKGIWVGLGVVLFGIVYYLFNPSASEFFPKCPFLLLTGLKCPGCGSQRAIHALLHFDPISAVRYNLLLVFSLPIVGILLYSEIFRKRNPSFYTRLHNPKYIWGYFAIVVAWWITRNIFDW